MIQLIIISILLGLSNSAFQASFINTTQLSQLSKQTLLTYLAKQMNQLKMQQIKYIGFKQHYLNLQLDSKTLSRAFIQLYLKDLYGYEYISNYAVNFKLIIQQDSSQTVVPQDQILQITKIQFPKNIYPAWLNVTLNYITLPQIQAKFPQEFLLIDRIVDIQRIDATKLLKGHYRKEAFVRQVGPDFQQYIFYYEYYSKMHSKYLPSQMEPLFVYEKIMQFEIILSDGQVKKDFDEFEGENYGLNMQVQNQQLVV